MRPVVQSPPSWSARASLPYPRLPATAQGPPHLARQVGAAARLAPAEAFRGHVAVLLCPVEPGSLGPAEAALQEVWPVDAVHALRCPVREWSQALRTTSGTACWLEHYVMREIQRRDPPSLLAILHRHGSGPAPEPLEAPGLVMLMRRWGVTCPVAVLGVADGGEVEWLSAPGSRLQHAG